MTMTDAQRADEIVQADTICSGLQIQEVNVLFATFSDSEIAQDIMDERDCGDLSISDIIAAVSRARDIWNETEFDA